jgi:uncharacterized protein (DUF488 family)
MGDGKEKKVWTIGHSTHPIDTFINMLNAFEIRVLADIRHYPGSRRYPHFNKDLLAASLTEAGIRYVHLVELGGRRKPMKDSPNSAWRNEAFRGYADHMQTKEFRKDAQRLQEIADSERTAYMCSEAVWWSCHRALLSDYFKYNGWTVYHIMSEKKADEHPYTKPARVVDGKLTYAAEHGNQGG